MAQWTCSDDYCECTNSLFGDNPLFANMPDDEIDCNSKAYKDNCGDDLKPCAK